MLNFSAKKPLFIFYFSEISSLGWNRKRFTFVFSINGTSSISWNRISSDLFIERSTMGRSKSFDIFFWESWFYYFKKMTQFSDEQIHSKKCCFWSSSGWSYLHNWSCWIRQSTISSLEIALFFKIDQFRVHYYKHCLVKYHISMEKYVFMVRFALSLRNLVSQSKREHHEQIIIALRGFFILHQN